MDFFNIGGSELLVLSLIALVLFGPEDMLKVARTIGSYAQQMRRIWNEFSTELRAGIETTEHQEETPVSTIASPEIEPSLPDLKDAEKHAAAQEKHQ